jgi:hypothetical protein
MKTAQDHKEKAADLQKQLDGAISGQNPSDREKLLSQMRE